MGLTAVGVAAFVAFSAVKELMGIDAPIPIAVLAWVLVVAVGVGAATWWRARLDTGLHDLILEGHEACRSANRTADQVRVGHKSEDGKSDRH